MKLTSIDIKNYRSIEHLNIPIIEKNGSYTYGLIGVNEAGKTAILKAISMFDHFTITKPSTDDFHKDSDKMEVFLNYELDKKILPNYPDLKDNKISIGFEVLKNNPNAQVLRLNYNNQLGEQKSEIITPQNNLLNIYKERYKVVFWTYDAKYLLDKEIVFTPQNVIQIINQNIPLKNCFQIAKIKPEDFQINITNSIEREEYQDVLSKSINKLIKERWPNQNIEIKFNLTETKINFHIKEKGTKSQKINQRSDGFRQFLSFLLSISAESASEELSDTIILLDEPETHLHPQAQKFFLEEIITLTKNKNNILFYSTHSGFLIDKNCIERTARVSKDIKKHRTDLAFLEKDNYSFARINYEIFEAELEGYHNELYDKLRDKFAQKFEKDFIEIKKFDEEFFKQEKKQPKNYTEKGAKNKVTLYTYIRNCIHYPINKNSKFEENLKKSIQQLIEWINEE